MKLNIEITKQCTAFELTNEANYPLDFTKLSTQEKQKLINALENIATLYKKFV